MEVVRPVLGDGSLKSEVLYRMFIIRFLKSEDGCQKSNYVLHS